LHGTLHDLASTTGSASSDNLASVKAATSACLGCLDHGLSTSASGNSTWKRCGATGRGEGQQTTKSTRNVANREAWWDGVLFLVNRRFQDEVSLGVLACLDAWEVGLQNLHGLLWVGNQGAQGRLQRSHAHLIQLWHASPLRQGLGFRRCASCAGDHLANGLKESHGLWL
jgi:hypothetical protein